MSQSLSEQANQQAIKKVQAETPQQFRVGATADILQRKADVTVSYDRKLSNALGLTAYLKAWWHDQAVIPTDKRGIVIGGEGVYKF